MTLRELVAAELAMPVQGEVRDMAEALARRYGRAARAVLFYGSCLRTAELNGQMLDFYLIVSDYRAAYGKGWLATANRLLPPNVFPFEHRGLAAKYAVLSQADFCREIGSRARSTSVWARFSQPSRLVWAQDDAAHVSVVDVVQDAAPTLFQYTLPMLGPHADISPQDVWKRGFALTYRAELRSERKDRSSDIVDVDPERYERFGWATLTRIAELTGVGPNGEVGLIRSPAAMARWWRRTQRRGKLLTAARLAKAAFTFAGGIDYLAWKINRHAGTAIAIRPWQRRHPFLAALTLLPRLLRSGAVR